MAVGAVMRVGDADGVGEVWGVAADVAGRGVPARVAVVCARSEPLRASPPPAQEMPLPLAPTAGSACLPMTSSLGEYLPMTTASLGKYRSLLQPLAAKGPFPGALIGHSQSGWRCPVAVRAPSPEWEKHLLASRYMGDTSIGLRIYGRHKYWLQDIWETHLLASGYIRDTSFGYRIYGRHTTIGFRIYGRTYIWEDRNG